jgi:hypothetical protein
MIRNDLNDAMLLRLSRAANWLQRLHQSPDDKSLLEKCRRWRDVAPENAKAFERMETVWQAMDQLATISRASPGSAETAWPTACIAAVESQRGSCHLQDGNRRGQMLVRVRLRATLPLSRNRLPRTARIFWPPAQGRIRRQRTRSPGCLGEQSVDRSGEGGYSSPSLGKSADRFSLTGSGTSQRDTRAISCSSPISAARLSRYGTLD